MSNRLSIDAARLYGTIDSLGEVGSFDDPHTGMRGVRRLALTEADGAGRLHVIKWMREAGLSVRVDQIGNVFARRAGQNDGLRPVMIGSHIDSVATAGRFDGCLGVLGGLEIIRTLNDAGFETLRPLVVAFFTDEEGARFGTDMLGSAVATGRITLEDAHALQDRKGLSVRDELATIGFLGEDDPRLTAPFAYLECHIEQGPILGASGVEVGVVTGVQGICWHEVTIVGRSAHAGTTPMSLRADAGVAAARINLALRDFVASKRFGPEFRATMGMISPYPSLVNVIPGRVIATVDLRDPDTALLDAAEAEVIAFYAEAARLEGVTITHRRTARTPFISFDGDVQRRIAEAADARGLSRADIVSGAGHDAQELSRICPAGMVFVPGELDGISHNPQELSTERQCANGVNVMLDVVCALAATPATAEEMS
jgi:beta-ureidopropionase / N-carbamoyl-L-amino-acid hydrolase